jgi:hypothetical protein
MKTRFDRERESHFRSVFGRAGLKYISRRHNPIIGGVVQSFTDSLYDQITVAAGAAFVRSILFQVGVGQGSGPKTLAQTNLTQSGGILPNPYRFTIWAMGCHISNNTIPADMQALVTNISATLLINNHPYQQGPLAKFPGGRGWQMVSGYSSVPQTAASLGISQTSTSNGALDQAFKFDIPITIEQGEQFQLVLNPETATNLAAGSAVNPLGQGAVITWYLDGNIEVGVS